MSQEMIRTVHFMCDQGAEDLFRCEENGRVYLRQRCDKDRVRWLTTCNMRNGYEADCPMKSGLVIKVVDSRGAVLFKEILIREDGYEGTVAKKTGPFSDEAIMQQAKSVAKQSKLKTYEDWKTMMMRSAREHRFTGYSDNWCYDADYGPVRPLFHFEYLGVPAYCTVQTATHKVSGQKWECVEIRDKSKQTVLEICGYVLEE